MEGRGWIARQGQTQGRVRGCSWPGKVLDISPQDEGEHWKGTQWDSSYRQSLWPQREDKGRVRETRESGARFPRGRWGPGVASAAVDTGVRGAEEGGDCVPSRIS